MFLGCKMGKCICEMTIAWAIKRGKPYVFAFNNSTADLMRRQEQALRKLVSVGGIRCCLSPSQSQKDFGKQ